VKIGLWRWGEHPMGGPDSSWGDELEAMLMMVVVVMKGGGFERRSGLGDSEAVRGGGGWQSHTTISSYLPTLYLLVEVEAGDTVSPSVNTVFRASTSPPPLPTPSFIHQIATSRSSALSLSRIFHLPSSSSNKSLIQYFISFARKYKHHYPPTIALPKARTIYRPPGPRGLRGLPSPTYKNA
jgi:hypothetical protein